MNRKAIIGMVLLGLGGCQTSRPMIWAKLDGTKVPPSEVPQGRRTEFQCRATGLQAASGVPNNPRLVVLPSGTNVLVDTNIGYKRDVVRANFEACMARAGYMRRPATDAEIAAREQRLRGG